jgi:hypothetical protein
MDLIALATMTEVFGWLAVHICVLCVCTYVLIVWTTGYFATQPNGEGTVSMAHGNDTTNNIGSGKVSTHVAFVHNQHWFEVRLFGRWRAQDELRQA